MKNLKKNYIISNFKLKIKNNYKEELKDWKLKKKDNSLKYSERKYLNKKLDNAYFLKNIINKIKIDCKNKKTNKKFYLKEKYNQFYPKKKINKNKLSPLIDKKKDINIKKDHYRKFFTINENKINTINSCSSLNRCDTNKKNISRIFKNINKDYKNLYKYVNGILNNN